ncbi:hypothetical protein ACJX0J_013760, partial [Zea mays]
HLCRSISVFMLHHFLQCCYRKIISLGDGYIETTLEEIYIKHEHTIREEYISHTFLLFFYQRQNSFGLIKNVKEMAHVAHCWTLEEADSNVFESSMKAWVWVPDSQISSEGVTESGQN